MSNYGDLVGALDPINSSPLTDIRDPRWLAKTVASAGLFNDGRPLYGEWQYAANSVGSPGLWQHPEEFATLLLRLSESPPRRVLDLGSFHGYGAALLAVYLWRFDPTATVVAADSRRWIPDPVPAALCGFDYRPGTTSADYDGRDFDFVLIDADHDYDAVMADYQRLSGAKVVAFHDIADAHVRDRCRGGGVWRAWRELKATRPSVEILRGDGVEHMGIGVLL